MLANSASKKKPINSVQKSDTKQQSSFQQELIKLEKTVPNPKYIKLENKYQNFTDFQIK